MKKIGYLFGSLSLLVLPITASAQLATSADGGLFQDLLLNVLSFINTVIIPSIIAIGFLVFVWGMFQYFIAGGANDEKKEQGKSFMIYATLGFVLIIVFWGIVNLLTQSTGLDKQKVLNTPEITIPG